MLQWIGMEVGELDAIVGGPPCQGFSVAGHKDPHDPRNNLVFEFARLVVECRPRTLVMENVPNIQSMVTSEGIPVLDAFCRILEEGDYNGHEAIRRALQAQGAVLIPSADFRRGRKPAKADRMPIPEPAAGDQMELFGAAAP